MLKRTKKIVWISTSTSLLVSVFSLGYLHLRSSRAQESIGQAEALLFADIDSATGLDRLHASSAISLIERAQRAGENSPHVQGLWHLAKGIEDFQKGSIVFSERELQDAHRLLGEEAHVALLAAHLSRARGLNDVAEQEAMHALSLDPQLMQAHLLLGDLYIDGQDPRAISHLETLRIHSPQSGLIWNRLGVAYEQAGRIREALEAYAQARLFEQVSEDPWINEARLARSLGRGNDAQRLFALATERKPTSGSAWFGLGLCLTENGQLNEAKEALTRAIALLPNDAEPLLALGDVLRNAGDLTAAETEYRRALSVETADGATWLKLGHVLIAQNRFAEAESAYRNALGRANTLSAAHNGLGVALWKQERFEEASSSFENASNLDPRDAHPVMNLALLMEERTQRNEAARIWQRVSETYPEAQTIAETHLARLLGRARVRS